MRKRMRKLWCSVTFRHKGRIYHDDIGIYWLCEGPCNGRSYVRWEDTPLGRQA